ncbi:MAG: hypothetical protein IJT13_03310, partial [Bacteroidaceae bacterium]|nr:hypothetical protein [Bacteroidaceae bacterium]
MKKQLTTLFLTAAALLMPFALTSCDEELQISEKVGSEPKPQTETVFSSMPSDTRTSMASTADSYNKYPFYWETGDKIWVDKAKNGSFTLESGSPSINASNRQQASFVFQELLTGSTYDLVYTGSASTQPNQVTIKNVQEQQGWNNSAHIGTSGDCATATASQTSSGN